MHDHVHRSVRLQSNECMIEENIIQHTKRFSYAIEAYTYMSGIWVLDTLQLRTLSFFEISYGIKHCGHDMIDIIFPVIDAIPRLRLLKHP
ncbi:hypothetical protein L208DRAFT_426964 [Tricholoma matsutake]|nr:hypothetical protein L208DRAFT_426964 [Tricholoma matsutake 945]